MEIAIARGTVEDLSSINAIYNHYIRNSNATFDTEEWGVQSRLNWFQIFNKEESPYNLLVAKNKGQVVGFAYNTKFKEKKAYCTSSEVTIYIKPDMGGQGMGAKLYDALFSAIDTKTLHRLYAAITLPNAASIRLHEKYGFELVGTMTEVGYKNGAYHAVSLYEKSLCG
ncbi:GNAT family N-acetyltransferase [Marinomonas algicola]|uniref:GNAT family N-acetyltransferase n=1 Tax=Marinomonas algicola TaxID=2773454 RepID=UPI00174BC1C7|nr:GNAT family N-acetyltransferase [Marinomonas algicola]